jgi:hypothetical protein
MQSWRWLFMHWMPWAFIFARVKDGRSSAARIAMMAMTTSSSMRVNPREGDEWFLAGRQDLLVFITAWFGADVPSILCFRPPACKPKNYAQDMPQFIS